jgi:hypothetical protein
MENGPPAGRPLRRNEVLVASLTDLLARAVRGEIQDSVTVTIGPGGLTEHACCILNSEEVPRMVGELSIMEQALRTIVVNQRAEAAQREMSGRPRVLVPTPPRQRFDG